MKILDISWPISEATTGYKDRHIVKFIPLKTFAKDQVRETEIHFTTHTGTHVDAPAHFFQDGITIDQVHLDRVVGTCKVIDCTYADEKISRDDIESHLDQIEEDDIILLKTANSSYAATEKFNPYFVYLDVSGAELLIKKKVRAVGIDYLGIEHSQPGHLTHHILMSNDILIIEGLRLECAQPGKYFFCCLPLNTIGLDAAPARAILIEGLVD